MVKCLRVNDRCGGCWNGKKGTSRIRNGQLGHRRTCVWLPECDIFGEIGFSLVASEPEGGFGCFENVPY
jgi:hypothetical protein